MGKLAFTLKRVPKEKNEELDCCKLLGSAVMPAGLLDGLRLKPEEYFVAQINCAALPDTPPFPNEGFLYFFVNINTMKPRVVYTEKEPEELIDNMDEDFDVESCGDPTCLKMEFCEESGSFLFGEIDHDTGVDMEVDTAGKLTLLQIDAYTLPEGKQKPLIFGNFGMLDGYWIFLVSEEDLAKRRFKNVELIEVEA